MIRHKALEKEAPQNQKRAHVGNASQACTWKKKTDIVRVELQGSFCYGRETKLMGHLLSLLFSLWLPLASTR